MIHTFSVSVPSMVSLVLCTLPGDKKFAVFLFDHHTFVEYGRVYANDFIIKAFEYGNAFGTVRYGKVYSCAPRSTLSLHC